MDRSIDNAALRSVLRVLMNKGHLSRRKVGKAYYYRPKQPAARAFRKMTRQLADIFCGGSMADLIVSLAKTEKLTEDDIRKLQQLAADRTSSKKS